MTGAAAEVSANFAAGMSIPPFAVPTQTKSDDWIVTFQPAPEPVLSSAVRTIVPVDVVGGVLVGDAGERQVRDARGQAATGDRLGDCVGARMPGRQERRQGGFQPQVLKPNVAAVCSHPSRYPFMVNDLSRAPRPLRATAVVMKVSASTPLGGASLQSAARISVRTIGRLAAGNERNSEIE